MCPVLLLLVALLTSGKFYTLYHSVFSFSVSSLILLLLQNAPPFPEGAALVWSL